MNETQMTVKDALIVLVEVKAKLGRNYKGKIRDAWIDGNYESRMLGKWDWQLQRIRNTLGPSWLVRVRV